MTIVDRIRTLFQDVRRKPRARRPILEALEGKLLMSTYYVATTGKDSNGGTSQAPWATIQQAANTVKPGDTVIVEPGKYTVSYTGISTTTSGTAAAPITFESQTKWGAQLYNPGNDNDNQQDVWTNSGDYNIINGFDISGNGANEDVWCGILDMGGSHCQFINNYVHDIALPNNLTSGGLGGIAEYTETPVAGHNLISGNYCTRIGTPGGGNLWHGIYAELPYDVISNNVCVGNMSIGITDGYYSTNETIVDNTCLGNGNGGIWIGGDNVGPEDYDVIANNICANNGGNGIYEDTDPGDGGVFGSHNQYLNNCVYGNTDGTIADSYGDIVAPYGTVSGTVTGNPMFVNYKSDGTGNYQLSAGTSCIGVGTSTDMPTTDFLGVARPSVGPYDIGAYQATSPSITGGSFETVLNGTTKAQGSISGGSFVVDDGTTYSFSVNYTVTLNGYQGNLNVQGVVSNGSLVSCTAQYTTGHYSGDSYTNLILAPGYGIYISSSQLELTFASSTFLGSPAGQLQFSINHS